MPLQFPRHAKIHLKSCRCTWSTSAKCVFFMDFQVWIIQIWSFKKKIIPSRCQTSSLHINEFSGIYALAHFVPNTRQKQCIEALCPFCILLNSWNANLSEESTGNMYLGAQPKILKKTHLELYGHQSQLFTPLKLPRLVHKHTCLPWKHHRETKIRDTTWWKEPLLVWWANCDTTADVSLSSIHWVRKRWYSFQWYTCNPTAWNC